MTLEVTPSRASTRTRFKLPRFARTPFLLSFLIGLVLALVSLIFYFRLQPVVPVFYSLPLQTQQLVVKEWIFFFPLFSLVISFLHLLIVNFFRDYSRLMLRLFSWVTLGIQVVLALSMIRIILIVS